MKSYNYICQSSWIQNYYNKLKFDEKAGFLVEIGVGNVIDYPDRDKYQKDGIVYVPETFTRLPSNTAELLDIGWSGLYVDPVNEYLTQAKVLHRDNLSRLKFMNCGASDKLEELVVGDYECLISNAFELTNACYYKRAIKCYPTSTIFDMQNCPKKIDLLSVDVEGMEDRVLRSIDYMSYSINMLIVETNRIPVQVIATILPGTYKLGCVDDLNAVFINTAY